MTEAEWLACEDWQPMLARLDRVGYRKATLYVCAGLRTIWDLLYDETSWNAVEVAERAADGVATQEEIIGATIAAECPTFGFDFEPQLIREQMDGVVNFPSVGRMLEMGVYLEADTCEQDRIGDMAAVERLSNAAHIAYHSLYQIDDEGLDEHLVGHLALQTEWPGGWLAREVFGNPFRPVIVAPQWRTPTVLAIAHEAYAERAFGQLPILADALEDDGCDAADLLAHLRSPSPHVRGCWALDLVLGLS